MGYPVNNLFANESLEELDDAYLLTLYTPGIGGRDLKVKVEGKELRVFFEKAKTGNSIVDTLNSQFGPKGGVIRNFQLKWEVSQENVSARQRGEFLFVKIRKKGW